MRRILFHWRGRVIYSYHALLYVGLVCGVLAGNILAHQSGLDAARVWFATLLLLIPALLGARLLFVITHWDHYRQAPRRIWDRSDGGAALYGGVPCALLASFPLLNILQLPFAAFWDIASVTVLVGMIFTRVGCLLNGCCAGRPMRAPWGLYLPNPQGVWTTRLPAPLLEAAWATILLGGVLLYWAVRPFAGAVCLAVMVGYGLGRLGLQFTRELPAGSRRWTLAHTMSAALLLVALAGFALAWPR